MEKNFFLNNLENCFKNDSTWSYEENSYKRNSIRSFVYKRLSSVIKWYKVYIQSKVLWIKLKNNWKSKITWKIRIITTNINLE
jgi:hypothetical protein